MIEYGHEDRWPANTWITLWINTYNRPPLLPAEIQPWLEGMGLDALNPEQGLFSIFGDSLIVYDEETEEGRSLIVVRDPSGLMTKAELLKALEKAPWTPTEAGPYLPSVSYWPQLSDETRDSQDAISAAWVAQRGVEETSDFTGFLGTLLKVGTVAAVGVVLYSLYRNATDEPLPKRRRRR